MDQEATQAKHPKTAILDNEYLGPSNAYNGDVVMLQKPNYLSHTAGYWGEIASTWLPLILASIFLIVFRRIRKKQEGYFKKYDHNIATQQETLFAIKETNRLLAEISQKLDKR